MGLIRTLMEATGGQLVIRGELRSAMGWCD